MIEGSGSGSWRPKNTWIRWIRIRIRNTATNPTIRPPASLTGVWVAIKCWAGSSCSARKSATRILRIRRSSARSSYSFLTIFERKKKGSSFHSSSLSRCPNDLKAKKKKKVFIHIYHDTMSQRPEYGK
jgi:hypothetical protein